MAEPFSLAASALQVAGAGLSLAQTLHAYLSCVKSAVKSIRSVATEVKLTASVLEHLGTLLRENEAEKLCTSAVVSDAKDALDGCREAFGEIEEAFKGLVKVGADGARTVSTVGKWSWPFKKGKLESLQANLERLKSTLLLMLSVLSYAREKATRPPDALSLQRVQIQNLIKAKDDATLRYEEMLDDLERLSTGDVKAESTLKSNSPTEKTAEPSQSSRSKAVHSVALRSQQMDPSLASNVHMNLVQLPSNASDGHRNSAFLLQQLGKCASAVSYLSASISTAVANHDAFGESEGEDIHKRFTEVALQVTPIVARTSGISSEMKVALHMLHRAIAARAQPLSVESSAGAQQAADSNSDAHMLEMERRRQQVLLQEQRQPMTMTNGGMSQGSSSKAAAQQQPGQPQMLPPQATARGNHALQDYQMQLMLLEQQNKKRLLTARQELEEVTHAAALSSPQRQQQLHQRQEELQQVVQQLQQQQVQQQRQAQQQAQQQQQLQRQQAQQPQAPPNMMPAPLSRPPARQRDRPPPAPPDGRSTPFSPGTAKYESARPELTAEKLEMPPSKKRKTDVDYRVSSQEAASVAVTPGSRFSFGSRGDQTTSQQQQQQQQPQQQQKQHFASATNMHETGPFATLEEHDSLGLDLDFGEERGDVLEEFDFDAFLEDDGDGREDLGLDFVQSEDADEDDGKVTNEAVKVKTVHENELVLDPMIDEVDELVKRWTTVEV